MPDPTATFDDFENLRVEVRDHVAHVTLDQPEQRNAMSPEMGAEIQSLVPRLNAAPDLRVVVFRGAGKAFSAGGNLDRLEEDALSGNSGEKKGQGIGGGRSFYSMFLSIRDLAMPTIAAINGHAIGAGFCFALGADLRVVHEKALLGMTFVRLGIHPGMAATWNLPRLVGPAAAADLLFTGRLVGAEEALRLGIAARIAGDDFDAVVDEMAEQIATAAPVAVRAVKQTLRGTYERSIDEAIGIEADEQARTFTTRDALEGIRAIKEKRSPSFENR